MIYDEVNFVFYSSSDGLSFDLANGILVGTCTVNTWTHLAVTSNGSMFMTFQDGVNKANQSYSAAPLDYNDSNLAIGAYHSSWRYWNGSIDELRIIKGTQLWNSNFEVPACPYGIYCSDGTYTSQVIDASSSVQWDSLNWTNTTDIGEIKFQSTSCSSSDCSDGTFVGSDNTSSTYFTSNASLNSTLTPNNRYFQYKAYLETSNTSITPYLESVELSYNAAPLDPSLILNSTTL